MAAAAQAIALGQRWLARSPPLSRATSSWSRFSRRCTADHEVCRPADHCRIPHRSSSSLGGVAAPGASGSPAKLSDFAKVPLLMKESPARVREIWLEQFRIKERAVAGVIAENEYNMLCASAATCPMFLVPIPRGSGYLNFVWQAQGARFVYQTLEAYQSSGGA